MDRASRKAARAGAVIAGRRNRTCVGLAIVGLAMTLPLAAMAQSAEAIQENYREADADGNGNLAYSEFVAFIDLNAADSLGNFGRVRAAGLHARAFERVDANGDGKVTPQEMQALRAAR